MDIMRPSQAFAAPPLAPLQDARRWLRLGMFALAATIAVAALLGAVR